MSIAIRRTGVPAKPVETRFVTQLIEAAKTPGFVARRTFRKPVVPATTGYVGSSDQHILASRAAMAAEISAMTDSEFAAYVEAEGLTMDHFLVDPLRAMRTAA